MKKNLIRTIVALAGSIVLFANVSSCAHYHENPSGQNDCAVCFYNLTNHSGDIAHVPVPVKIIERETRISFVSLVYVKETSKSNTAHAPPIAFLS